MPASQPHNASYATPKNISLSEFIVVSKKMQKSMRVLDSLTDKISNIENTIKIIKIDEQSKFISRIDMELLEEKLNNNYKKYIEKFHVSFK